MKNEIVLTRDFDGEMKAIFKRHPLEAKQKAAHAAAVFVAHDQRRFNVVKETESGSKVVEFGITFLDALRAVDGRFADSEAVKFHVVPSEVV